MFLARVFRFHLFVAHAAAVRPAAAPMYTGMVEGVGGGGRCGATAAKKTERVDCAFFADTSYASEISDTDVYA